jgi:hypothetical protein
MALPTHPHALCRELTFRSLLLLAGLLGPAAAAADEAEHAATTIAPALDPPEEAPAAADHVRIPLAQARRHMTSIARRLEGTPGVQIRSSGGLFDAARVQMRGAGPQQTRLLLDGIPLDAGWEPGADLSLLPPELLQEVEVWKAHAPLTLAPAAPGGLIHLRTGRPADPWLGSVSAGSFGSARGALVHGARTGDRLVALTGRTTRGTIRWYDNAGTLFDMSDDDADARRRNHDAHQLAGLVREDLRPGSWHLRLLSWGQVLRRGDPGIATSPALRTRTGREQGQLALQARRRRLAGDHLDLEMLASLMTVRQRFADPDGELTLLPTDSRLRARQVLVAMRPTWWTTHRRWQGEASVEVQSERLRGQLRTGTDTGRLLEPADRTQGGAAHTLQWRPWRHPRLSRWTVAAAGRTDAVLDRGPGRQEALRWLPTAQGSLHLPLQAGQRVRLQPRAQVTASRRPPGFLELWGNQGQVRGNPTLTDESRTALDLGGSVHLDGPGLTRWTLGWTRVEAWSRDLIVFQTTATGVSVPFNLDGARHRGHEASLHAALPRGVRVWAQGSLTDTSQRPRTPDRDTGRQLPWVPREAGTAGLGWDAGPWHLESRWLYQGAVWIDRAGTRGLPARSQWDAALGWTHRPSGWSVAIDGFNLLDARSGVLRLPDGGTLREATLPLGDVLGAPLAGRAAWLTLSWAGPPVREAS